MLEADEWPRVLANVRGTVVGRTERVSSNRLMDLLGVENDPTRRREVGKRCNSCHRPVRAGASPELGHRACGQAAVIGRNEQIFGAE